LPQDAEAGGGLMVAVIQLAITGGATVGGVLLDRNGYQATFDTSAALLVIAAVLAILAARAAAQTVIIPLLQKQGGGVIVDTFLGLGSNTSPAKQPTAHPGTELIGLTKEGCARICLQGYRSTH
jgi:MFS family permease